MEKIMKLLGYENINNIKIKKAFERNLPKINKMSEKLTYYIKNNKYEQPIVLDNENWLIDGYTTYLIAKYTNEKYVKVRRIK